MNRGNTMKKSKMIKSTTQYVGKKESLNSMEHSEQLVQDDQLVCPVPMSNELDEISEILKPDNLSSLLENDKEELQELDIDLKTSLREVLEIGMKVEEECLIVPVHTRKRKAIEPQYSEDEVSFTWNEVEELLLNGQVGSEETDVETIKSFCETRDILDDIMLVEQEDWMSDDIAETVKEDIERQKNLFNQFLSNSEFTEEELLRLLEGNPLADVVNRDSLPIKQFENQATPYVYGKQVIENNQLCYLNATDSGNMLHIFNGRYWQYLDDDSLKQLVYDALPEYIKKMVTGIEHLITNVANYVKREVRKAYNDGRKRFSDMDYHDIENRIVFTNCVYDVKTGKKMGFSSKKPYCFAVNCEYIDEDLETPYYDKFKFDSTQGDIDSMEMFDYLQAYLLIPNRKGKCFFIMSYAKDSGKTSFGEFIEKYFPDELVKKIDIEHLGGKFSYAGLEKAVLVSCLEMPLAKLSVSATKALKNFTGESKIEVEAKYQNHFTSVIKFKTLLASNGGLHLPIGERDDAFFRRAIVIPFVHSTPLNELIADMPQKWETERAAIISKCVRKFKQIISDDGGIVFPESLLSKEIKARWMGVSLLNERFIKDAIIFTADKNDAIPKKDLERVYDVYYHNSTYDMGNDRPIKCNKDELVKMILGVYPNAATTKVRRTTLSNPEKKENIYCVVCVKWNEQFLSELEELKTNEVTYDLL